MKIFMHDLLMKIISGKIQWFTLKMSTFWDHLKTQYPCRSTNGNVKWCKMTIASTVYFIQRIHTEVTAQWPPHSVGAIKDDLRATVPLLTTQWDVMFIDPGGHSRTRRTHSIVVNPHQPSFITKWIIQVTPIPRRSWKTTHSATNKHGISDQKAHNQRPNTIEPAS